MNVMLDGWVTLITGGSKGLGLDIAMRMAASGADIAMLARRADVLEEARRTVEATTRGKVHVIACNVSKADEVSAAFAKVPGALRRVNKW